MVTEVQLHHWMSLDVFYSSVFIHSKLKVTVTFKETYSTDSHNYFLWCPYKLVTTSPLI